MTPESARRPTQTLRAARAAGLLRRCAFAALVAIACAGCSSVRPWINQPLLAGARPDVAAVAQRDSSALFAVALSGGGARAAAFGVDGAEHAEHTDEVTP